jgi:hypothetical protein
LSLSSLSCCGLKGWVRSNQAFNYRPSRGRGQLAVLSFTFGRLAADHENTKAGSPQLHSLSLGARQVAFEGARTRHDFTTTAIILVGWDNSAAEEFRKAGDQ